MTLHVYKYPFNMTGEQTEFELPIGAKLLHVAAQHNAFHLWALVDDDTILETRVVRIVGTGHDIPYAPARLAYLNTIMIGEGRFVFHAFEIKDA